MPIDPAAAPLLIRLPGLALRLWRGWLQGAPISADSRQDLERHLRDTLPWRQPRVTVFGRAHPVPRLTCWVGDPGCAYRYSGHEERPIPWSPRLLELRRSLEQQLGCPFNSLLLNRYRNGVERMGWHADDERELAADHPIASLSLGASRTLRFRPRPGSRAAGAPAWNLELADGDLLVMEAPTQRHWHHSLPARRKVEGERINLTFRQIKTIRQIKTLGSISPADQAADSHPADAAQADGTLADTSQAEAAQADAALADGPG